MHVNRIDKRGILNKILNLVFAIVANSGYEFYFLTQTFEKVSLVDQDYKFYQIINTLYRALYMCTKVNRNVNLTLERHERACLKLNNLPDTNSIELLLALRFTLENRGYSRPFCAPFDAQRVSRRKLITHIHAHIGQYLNDTSIVEMNFREAPSSEGSYVGNFGRLLRSNSIFNYAKNGRIVLHLEMKEIIAEV